MNTKRVLFFLLFIVTIGLAMQQYWISKTPGEKWLYFFGDPARDYAGDVLGQGRDTYVPVPQELTGSQVIVHSGFVTFSPKQDPGLVLAFSPAGPPPGEDYEGRFWSALGDGWYLLQ